MEPGLALSAWSKNCSCYTVVLKSLDAERYRPVAAIYSLGIDDRELLDFQARTTGSSGREIFRSASRGPDSHP